MEDLHLKPVQSSITYFVFQGQSCPRLAIHVIVWGCNHLQCSSATALQVIPRLTPQNCPFFVLGRGKSLKDILPPPWKTGLCGILPSKTPSVVSLNALRGAPGSPTEHNGALMHYTSFEGNTRPLHIATPTWSTSGWSGSAKSVLQNKWP